MFNKKANRIISIIMCLYCFFLYLLSVINSYILSTNTKQYKDFKKIANNNKNYEYLLINDDNYVLKKDEAEKIINDFIDLELYESFSISNRIIISNASIYFCLYYLCFFSKIKNLNEAVYRKKIKCKLCCFNVIIIIEMILMFYEIIFSIIMIKYRNNNIIPYIKLIITGKNKFNSKVKTCKNFDIMFLILLLISLFGLILLEIQIFNRNRNCCFNKCCKDNEQQEINVNQNLNQPYLYNPNYNNNIYNRNPRLVYPGRNIATGQYVFVEGYQISNNNLNSQNNFNQNRIENVPINNINYRDNVNELNRNFNNINNENNRENNNEIFLKKLLRVCNKDKFNSNKYKKHEDCRICLMKFENNENILILPCLHIFHMDCIINWLNNKKTCPLDNQNLENYLY